MYINRIIFTRSVVGLKEMYFFPFLLYQTQYIIIILKKIKIVLYDSADKNNKIILLFVFTMIQ